MSSIRHYIDLVESSQGEVDEAYSKENSWFRNYMRDDEFDPYANWHGVCLWIFRNDYGDEINEIIQQENPGADPVDDADELNEYEPDLFYKLPKDAQERCAEEVTEYMMAHDPAEASTTAHMSLSNKNLLHNTTWLIHFSDHAIDIAYNGFKYGMDEMDKLGLTTWFKQESKKYGGYNFAFSVDKLLPYMGSNYTSNYGRDAVIFQSSGVHCYHYGDEEDQVVFWGADVDPHNIILLRHNTDYEQWEVRRKGDSRAVYADASLKKVCQWVMNHHRQYARALGGK